MFAVQATSAASPSSTKQPIIRLEDHIGNKCAIVCFNVSILGKYYIYAYFVICLRIESKFVLFACFTK